MQIAESIAFVTGANQGIGRALVEALLANGAAKIYGADFHTDWLEEKAAAFPGRVVSLALDIRDADRVAAAAERCDDVNLLINNAAITKHIGLFHPDSVVHGQAIMETNFFGTLNLCRAFAGILKANGGGMLINVLSIAALVHIPRVGLYSASKAALRSLTQGVRAELAGQGTKVMAVYVGPVDTEMSAHRPQPKAAPHDIAQTILDGAVHEVEDLYPDKFSAEFGASLTEDPKALERRFAAQLPEE